MPRPSHPREIGAFVSEMRAGAGRIDAVTVRLEITLALGYSDADILDDPAIRAQMGELARKIELAAQTQQRTIAALADEIAAATR